MQNQSKSTRINLFDFRSPQMRAFHLTWFAFFLCFFGWFGIAPLTAVVRDEFQLSKTQLGNIMIASVGATIFARLFVGWLLDRIGPRLTYTGLLLLGALPVMGIGLANSYETFLIGRLLIGLIGASFVITQYHTTAMFAPNVVGAANATTAGWGNMGGGVTQMAMPAIFGGIMALGASQFLAWRLAMVVPGALMLLTGVAYYFLTQDTPEGNFAELKKQGKLHEGGKTKGAFMLALKDPRVWALLWLYGACFGVELIIHNMAALYFKDNFNLPLGTAGMLAGLLGLMAIFARTLGGYLSDRVNLRWGLKARPMFLGVVILMEGLFLLLFGSTQVLPVAVLSLVMFGLFVHMSTGATYAVTPYINPKAMGPGAGLVGAGGNLGAGRGGFLFRMENISQPQALSILGVLVMVSSVTALMVRFSEADIRAADGELEKLLAARAELSLAS